MEEGHDELDHLSSRQLKHFDEDPSPIRSHLQRLMFLHRVRIRLHPIIIIEEGLP